MKPEKKSLLWIVLAVQSVTLVELAGIFYININSINNINNSINGIHSSVNSIHSSVNNTSNSSTQLINIIGDGNSGEITQRQKSGTTDSESVNSKSS